MNKNNNFFFKLWMILYPFALYYATNLIAMGAALFVLGIKTENYVIAQIFGAAVTIPVIYNTFYKPDHMYLKRDKHDAKRIALNATVIIIMALLLGTGLNNVISMSPLVKMSEGYAQANEHFYGSTIAFEILCSGIMVPILEELVFRGVILNRLKITVCKRWPSILLSALLFAAIHVNIVQFPFALLLGTMLAIIADNTGHLYGPILAHVAINTMGVLRTEFDLLGWMVDKSMVAWSSSIGILVAGMIILAIYEKKHQ